MNNKQIIIKPADKSTVVVVIDLDEYLWEGQRHLSDTRYYPKFKKKHVHKNFHSYHPNLPQRLPQGIIVIIGNQFNTK